MQQHWPCWLSIDKWTRQESLGRCSNCNGSRQVQPWDAPKMLINDQQYQAQDAPKMLIADKQYKARDATEMLIVNQQQQQKS